MIDKLNMIGGDKGGLYLFDRDLLGMSGGAPRPGGGGGRE
jgi:hypothetical protein